MAKFFTIIVLLAGSFAAGFYFGQRPVGTLQQTVADLQKSVKDVSRNVMDTTIGIERDLRRRQGLVDAKSRLIQAKARIIERNFGEAAKELSQSITAVEDLSKQLKSDTSTAALSGLAESLREAKLELLTGKTAPVKKLDEIQYRMDQLLNK